MQEYFRSGWAFFIPYLAAYLLYAWIDWPVNPAGSGVRNGVPCLLHVYWTLHALHLVLGAFALRFWWRSARSPVLAADRLPASRFSSLGSGSQHLSPISVPAAHFSLLATLPRFAPWLCLGLIFWIPGIYLEWPSDPWEHLRRINEWHAHEIVTAHSAWKKSSYFLPYSLTGHATGLVQLSWLNVYYTAVCLLLSWQYYRLGRAAGLSSGASFVFVLLSALTFGNNIFSFYRYYGLSPSLPAQITAVALTRNAIEWVCGPSADTARPVTWMQWSVRLVVPAACLALLTSFNHLQGLGLSTLGLIAVIVWRVVALRRAGALWLALAALLASIVVVALFPRHPAVDEVFRPQGWLTNWYGFDLFSASSPALDRTQQILGAFGLLNLAAGSWLILRHNHLIGWLTLTPILAVVVPCFALPLAHTLAARSSEPGAILTFHRMFLAVPPGLALVAFWWKGASEASSRRWKWTAGLVAAAGAAALIWPGHSSRRGWHSLQVTSQDLELRHVSRDWSSAMMDVADREDTVVVATPLAARMREALRPSRQTRYFRHIRDQLPPLNALQYLPPAAVLPNADWSVTSFRAGGESTVLSRSTSDAGELQLSVDFLAEPQTWRVVSGLAPQRIDAEGKAALANPPASSSQALSPTLVPISPGRRYRAMAMVRQEGDPTATNFLGIAWYDRAERQLTSNVEAPEGAGSPPGWSNGTYSYFGLLEVAAAGEWSTYSIDFGLGEAAVIPHHAAYAAGAILLNYNGRAQVRTIVREFRLEHRPAHNRVVLVVPTATKLFSAQSTAARLSGHWSPQRVALDAIGAAELAPILDASRVVAAAKPSPAAKEASLHQQNGLLVNARP